MKELLIFTLIKYLILGMALIGATKDTLQMRDKKELEVLFNSYPINDGVEKIIKESGLDFQYTVVSTNGDEDRIMEK